MSSKFPWLPSNGQPTQEVLREFKNIDDFSSRWFILLKHWSMTDTFRSFPYYPIPKKCNSTIRWDWLCQHKSQLDWKQHENIDYNLTPRTIMRSTETATASRLWLNRCNGSSRSSTNANGVYDDYNECVFPHLRSVPPLSIQPIAGPRNECSLPPYLGPRDGTRVQFPCEYSVSIPDDIMSFSRDVETDSEVSSLGYEGDLSSRFISQGRNDFIPFLNYDNDVRVHERTNRNSNMPFLNYFPTRRNEEVSTRNRTYYIQSVQSSVSEDDDISYTTDEMTQTTCTSTNASSKPSVVHTTLLPMGKNEENLEDVGCIFDNKVLRDLSDFIEKVFGWRRQVPVLSCEPEISPSYTYDNLGYIPDIDDSSCSSASAAPVQTRWSR